VLPGTEQLALGALLYSLRFAQFRYGVREARLAGLFERGLTALAYESRHSRLGQRMHYFHLIV
jgi:hypothetical protein